jgi:putative phosphoesterase
MRPGNILSRHGRGESQKMKIGVISDTHARHFSELSPNLVQALSKVDLIIHAGDIVTMDVVRGLETLAAVTGVCGNMDFPEVRAAFPDRHTREVLGKKIGIVHGSGGPWKLEERVAQLFPGFDVVIFGHSHLALNKTVAGTLLFNPGCARDSYGLLEIGERIGGVIRADYDR